MIAQQVIGTGATATPPRAGPPTSRDLALVHAAIHDAVQAFAQRFEPYHAHVQGAAGSPSAAAAQAARDVLAAYYPAQIASLDATLATYLANNGLAANDPGLAIGAQAAAAIVALRASDGYFPATPPPPFVGGTDVGEWRPTPSYLAGPPAAFSPMAAPWLASVTPLVLDRPSRFRPDGPPRVRSSVYTRQYAEVKALGSLTSTERGAARTDLAYFWSGNFPGQWNQVTRDLAVARSLDLSDSARLLALVNLAVADAVVTAWDSKLHFNFWRPVTAIQEGDADGNPRTTGDATWQPLINTPNYPDFTSGANNLTGAATRMLQRYFRTNEIAFSVTTTVPLAVQKTRSFTRLSDAAQEVVDARVLLGIHFRFADTVARKQGRRVADYVYLNALRAID